MRIERLVQVQACTSHLSSFQISHPSTSCRSASPPVLAVKPAQICFPSSYRPTGSVCWNKNSHSCVAPFGESVSQTSTDPTRRSNATRRAYGRPSVSGGRDPGAVQASEER